jgi:hypothetical protein
MAPRRSRPRRFLLPTLLAAVLAGELTGIALAHTLTPAVIVPTASTPAAAAAASTSAGSVLARRPDGGAPAAPATSTPVGPRFSGPAAIALPPAIGPASLAHVTKAAVRHMTTSVARSSSGGSHPRRASYVGRNHVWIPSLGINKTVQSFPCSRSRPPDAGVYRWGCAGHNNVYLLAHAWSTFKPLHDAYVAGRLHTGMRVIYADGGGTVHTFSVVWWRVVAPTTAASWAWAALSKPSMTLQTCVGANSAYRLMVRLVQVG